MVDCQGAALVTHLCFLGQRCPDGVSQDLDSLLIRIFCAGPSHASETAAANRHSVVIRPRSMTSLLIQLDDFTAAQAEKIAPQAFMTVCTSPGNYQVWLAVADGPKDGEEAAKQFRTRVRRGAGADHSATGATRIAGSLNFKAKYAPGFPRVEIASSSPGHLTTVAVLAQAG